MSFLQLLLLFLPLLVLFLFPRKKNGFKTYPLIGILPEFIKNRHRFHEWITECIIATPTHTITFEGMGRTGSVITANPACVEYMLKTNFHNYPKGHLSIGMLEDIFGHTVFNSDGKEWQWQRKTASYEFNKRTLQNFLAKPVKNEVLHRLLPLLAKAAEEGSPIDLQNILERFFFDSISCLAFSDDPACLADKACRATEFTQALEEAERIIVRRYNDLFPLTWKIKKVLNIGSERKLKNVLAKLDSYADRLIEARQSQTQGNNTSDLLSRFTTNDSSSELLRSLVISFAIAGRETASSALVFLFWLLSSRPEVTKRIREEIVTKRSSNVGDIFSYDKLRELHYLHATVTESMRLFPPIPVDTSTTCMSDDRFPDGTVIREGWSVTYSAFAMGRLEDVWGPDCREFRPERWLEDGKFKAASPFKYPVFHGGPRLCLGRELAYLQIKTVAAAIVERFEVCALVDGTPELVPAMTMRMKGGLQVVVKAVAMGEGD